MAHLITDFREFSVSESVMPLWDTVTELQPPLPPALRSRTLSRVVKTLVQRSAYPEDFVDWDQAVIDIEEFHRYRRRIRLYEMKCVNCSVYVGGWLSG